jgi:hypothetical protein
VEPESPASDASEPEKKITPDEARELLRSVDDILKFVSEDTGLAIRHKVKRRLVNRDQVAKYIADRMKDDEDTKRLEHSELVLKKFGLVPRGFNLEPFLLSLLKEQVAGYYDSKTKTVNLLDWVEAGQQRPVLAHELTHALQDQNFGLDKLSKSAKKDDPTGLEADERLAARQAVIEGQGMIVLMDYTLAPLGGSVAKQPEVVDAMIAGLAAGGPGMAVYSRAPLFMQQVLLFPYRYGMTFERDLLVAGGREKAFAGALSRPPEDTRQVMLSATYLSGQVFPPMKPLDFGKLAPQYKKWDVSNMGEFDVFLLLDQFADSETARGLSPQWRGGYYWAGRAAAGPKDDRALTTSDLAVVYLSKWASPETAARFAGEYARGVTMRYPDAHLVSGEQGEVGRWGIGESLSLLVPAAQSSNPSAPPSPVSGSRSPRLAAPATWETSDGQVTIEPHGDLVLIMESLDPQAAKAVHDAAFASSQ